MWFLTALLALAALVATASGAAADGKPGDGKDTLVPVWVTAAEVKGKVSPQPAPNPPDPPKAPADGNAVAAGYPQAVVPPPVPPPIMPPPLKNFRLDAPAAAAARQSVLGPASDAGAATGAAALLELSDN